MTPQPTLFKGPGGAPTAIVAGVDVELPAAPSLPPVLPGWRVLFQVRVYGAPKGQPRARAFARKFGAKFSARVYDPGTADSWKEAVAEAVRRFVPAVPVAGPVCCDATFLFARPAKLDRRKDPAGRIPHTGKPDRDNCDKAVLDCLTTVGVWADDAQVCEGAPRKFYVAKGELPGAELRVCLPVTAEGGRS